jgi:hypothetical protein
VDVVYSRSDRRSAGALRRIRIDDERRA